MGVSKNYIVGILDDRSTIFNKDYGDQFKELTEFFTRFKYFGKIYSDYSKSKIKFDNSYEIDMKSLDEIPVNIKKYCENNDIDFSDWPLKEKRIR